MENIIINNLEFRETRTMNGVLYYEIIRWIDNDLFHAEMDYLNNGYIYAGGYISKGNVYISLECFKNMKTALTLATFTIIFNKIHRHQLTDRIKELTECELMDYNEVKRQGLRYLKTFIKL